MNGGSLCFGCFLPIVIIIVHLVLALWVYRDAEKRGEKGVLWLIVFLVGGIIGLIVWLIVRPKDRTTGVLDDQWEKNKYK